MMYVHHASTSQREPGESPSVEWIAPDPLPADLDPFHEDPLLHAILARRVASAAEAADFLDDTARAAPDPHLLPGMTEAVARVAGALRSGEPIGVFGDYDTDGVTSAALLTLAFRAASAGRQPVAARLPRRDEGYGLSVAGVDDLAEAGVWLLIAVDCGSKDHAAVERARHHGMDVVILDHHRLTGPPPEGATLASAQLREDAPYKSLSAAGIAYLLATALAHEGFDTGDGPGNEPVSLLDLAMIGIIGDVSPLTGVNRALVRDGLNRLRARPRPGIRALCNAAGIDPRTSSSRDIAFMVSPRLNAPGRLGDPRPAYELLVTNDPAEAARLAERIEAANQKRKVLQDRVFRDVEAKLAASPSLLDRRVLVLAGADWESGIVGLAAGKLVEKYDRPVLVLSLADGMARGSARSVAKFDITGALGTATHLLSRHGGHEGAAGLALPETNLAALDEALQEAIANSPAEPPGPRRIQIDAELDPERMRLRDANLLQTLGPFGQGNPAPVLRVSRLPIRGYATMGREKQHLKILTAGHAGPVDAILWGAAARSRELLGARHVDLVGSLEANVWNGSERVQMKLVDFRRSE